METLIAERETDGVYLSINECSTKHSKLRATGAATVSWLSAAPSVLEVCVQSVYYPDQLKTLFRHHRSLGQLDMNATLPSIEECKLSSTSPPPSQTMMGSTKLTNTNSQSESITDCINCLSPASSGEAIKVEPVMDSSDYTGVEPVNRCEDIEERTERKTGYFMSREQTDILTNMKEEKEDGERQSVKIEGDDGVRDEEGLWKKEEKSGLNRCEDIEDRREEKTGYFMGREQKDILTNMKKEEDGERRVSVKMEGEDGVRDEEKLWKKEEKQRDEPREGYVNDQVAQTDTLVNNGVISEHRQQEVEELSSLITSCQHKQPRVLIRRLEVDSRSVPVSLPPCIMACKRGQGVRSPWRRQELLPLRGNGSVRQKKGQVMTRKRKTNGQLERPLKMLPSSLENRICAEASLISPVISPRNRNTGKTVEVSSQVFACSQCPFVHTEEVNLHQHIETVHPEELNTTVRSQQPPSSTHQHPTPSKTPPTLTQSHTDTPGSHTCSQCGKRFHCLSHLKAHKRSHTGGRPYHCSQCDKSFNRSNNLKQHQRTHTGERPYHCSQCGGNFSQLGAFNIHQRTHTGDCPYHCSQCEKSFNSSNSLKKHHRTHSGERPYQCSQCGKSFTELGNLKQHQRIHTGEHPYRCSPCGKSFIHLNSLRIHQNTHTETCLYHCSQCGRSFSSAAHLKQHQRTHTGERPYQCSQCEKSFYRSGTLKQHQRTHTGERPYHCSQCEKSFSQSITLKVHQRTHTGERPYHCSQCKKSFSQSITLKVHQRTHTGDCPYQCSQCEKRFNSSGSLKQHQRTHTGERPYQCSQCEKSFIQMSNLKRHQLTHLV